MSAIVIGIGVSRTELRIVAARRNVVVWVTSATRDRDEALSATVERTLSARPSALRRGVCSVAVIGPGESQLRPLSGLPPVRAEAELHALISENVDRFFVCASGSVRVSTPRTTSFGDTWASAVDETVLTGLAAGCRAAGVTFVGALPVAAALHHLAGVENERDADTIATREVAWIDEGTRLHLSYEGWAPRRVLRERAMLSEQGGLATPATLPDTVPATCADAYAATRVRRRDPFVIGEHTEHHLGERRARLRTWIWGAATIASVALAAWAPAALSLRRSVRARSHVVVLREKARDAGDAQRALAAATAELNLVSRFEASRRSATLLLGEIALALPESTAITALRIDSLGGNLSVVTPHAAAAMEAMTTVPGIKRVQVSGAMMRETTNGIELERATIRFAFGTPGAIATMTARRP